MLNTLESNNGKLLLILVVVLGCVVSVMLLPPVAQDLNYHLFADQETWLGVLSGHSLKHLIAAAAILCAVLSFPRASPQR